MNLCGLAESVVSTPVGPKARRPNLPPSSSSSPAPFQLSIAVPPPCSPLPPSYEQQQPSQVLFQTPHCSIGWTSTEGGATPSPALLNPLTNEFWNESSSRPDKCLRRRPPHIPRRGDAHDRREAPPACPKLESTYPKQEATHNQEEEALVKRLQSGFRVKLDGRVVEIRLADDSSVLHIVNDAHCHDEAKGPFPDDSDESQVEVHPEEAIFVQDMERIEHNVDDMKRFSIVLKECSRTNVADTNATLDFECVGIKQQEAIVTAIRYILAFHSTSPTDTSSTYPSFQAKDAQWLRMRPRNCVSNDAALPACSGTNYTASDTNNIHPPALTQNCASRTPLDDGSSSLDTAAVLLSPMQRTCIYAAAGGVGGSSGAITEQGTELALHPRRTTASTASSGGAVTVGKNRMSSLSPRPTSTSYVTTNAFSFSEVSEKQSLREQHQQDRPLGSNGSMFVSSLQEALDKWCTQDACIDLSEVAESLEGIFFLVGSQNNVRPAVDAPTTSQGANYHRHRADSSADLQTAATLCVKEFLQTPAAIWAELPSPNTSYSSYDETNTNSDNNSIVQNDTRTICNRASVANAQAYRWKQLQNEMTFESVHSRDKCWMPSIETTKSLDDLDGTDERVASSQRIASGNFTETSGYGLFELFPSGFWEDEEDPTGDSEDCFFYDSDPECARMQTRKKGPRRVKAERLNRTSPATTKRTQRLNFSVPHFMAGHFDDEYVAAIVEVMKSARLPLLWHRTPTRTNPTMSPLCVSAWIERGTCLSTKTFLQPKFMWRQTSETKLEARRLSIASESPERLDLLGITRVQDAPTIDRKEYPFANKRRCFIIETQKERHLFEAQSIREKKRIVFGLKLTISRLASLVMVRDSRAVEEFFEPEQVPGEAPNWSRSN